MSEAILAAADAASVPAAATPLAAAIAAAAPAAPAAPAAQPAAIAAPAAPATPVGLTSEQLRQRLAEERGKGSAETLRRYGVEKPEDLDAKLAKLATLEAAQLTAEERTAKQLADLAKAADAGKVYETVAQAAVTELFEALPDVAKAAITELAPKSPAELLQHIRTFRKLDAAVRATMPVAAATPAVTPPPPPPAAPVTTTPAHGAPKPGSKTPFEVYSDMKARNDPSAPMFYSMQKRAIEASRPAAG